MSEKIQKVLARKGLASRREIELWIEAGRIKINNRLATLGDRVSTDDKIFVDGEKVKFAEPQSTRLIIYNKPEGELVTRDDPQQRDTVFHALPHLDDGRWISVGRLDVNTSGLLLFTNDGELAHRLTHPSSNLGREYAVRIFGDVTSAMVKELVTGVQLEDGFARFEDVVDVKRGRGSNRWFNVVIAQGRQRIVRRLWESQGLQVSRLKRVRFGPVVLPDKLLIGKWSELKGAFLAQLISSLD
jgi:23S rRNA pseudouridine2605 synthase